jgi:hypothetical protein
LLTAFVDKTELPMYVDASASGKKAAHETATGNPERPNPERPCLLRRNQLGATFDSWMPLSEAPATARAAYLASSAFSSAAGMGSSCFTFTPGAAVAATRLATESIPVEASEFRAILCGLMPLIRTCPSQRRVQFFQMSSFIQHHRATTGIASKLLCNRDIRFESAAAKYSS